MQDKLDNIRIPVAPGTQQDDPDTNEIAKKHAYNELEREQQQALEDLNDRRQDRQQRKEYAEKIFLLVCAWLAILFIIIWHTGIRLLCLSDTILIALITGATIDIIGLMVIVISYLFPKHSHLGHGKK